jgi:putative addiction module CopG family antidote
MTITLTTEIEEFISRKVQSGAYQSPADVILTSLRLLEAQEKGMDALRHEILRGVEDIQQGRFTAYQTDEELESLSDKIIRRSGESQKPVEK